MPPEVGYADTSSLIVNPMIRMKTPRIGHDPEIEIGPPLLKPAPKLVKHRGRMEMIENEIAKLENPDHERCRSCRYPSLARCFSSSVSSAAPAGAGSNASGMTCPFRMRNRLPGGATRGFPVKKGRSKFRSELRPLTPAVPLPHPDPG